jgi:hypothetical protein
MNLIMACARGVGAVVSLIMSLYRGLFVVLAAGLAASSAAAQPVNDNFASRTAIQGTNVTVTGSLAGATAEAGEPFLDGISSGQTAWWSWIAPANGIVTLAVSGTNFNPLVTVYVGNSLPGLALAASNNYLICYSNADCGCHWRMRDQITFHVAAGQQYQLDADSPIITDASYGLQQEPGSPIEVINPDGTTNTLPGPILEFFGAGMTTNILPGGDVNLQLQFTAAPTNDSFANRTKLTGSRTRVNANNSGATTEPGEPEKTGNPGGSSIWYTWTAPASGRVTLSTNNIPPYLPPSYYENQAGVVSEFESDSGNGLTSFSLIDYSPGEPSCGAAVDQDPPPPYFPVLAAYTGTSVSALTPANCLPVGLPGYPYAIEFDALKGHAYQIAVDGNRGTTGDITLYLALTTPAANDLFANRVTLHGIYAVVAGYNAGAVPQAGAPNLGNGSTGKIAWWSWTAPVSGPVFIDLTGSDFAFPAAVFTGNALSRLRLAAASAGGVSFNAVAGQTYQIAVGDASGQTGAIAMTLQAPVVEAPLLQVLRGGTFDSALLWYAAARGQVLLLLRSSDGVHWREAQTATAWHNGAQFYVTPAPSPGGVRYQAIIVDLVSN